MLLAGSAVMEVRVPAVPLPDRPMISPGGAGLSIYLEMHPERRSRFRFPAIYRSIPSHENSRIIRVFACGYKGEETRNKSITPAGTDAVRPGLYVTNAGQRSGLVSAYFMKDLSTPDREDGAVAPGWTL